MRVTVIPADRWIRLDQESASLPSWPFDDNHIHAIQWYGSDGEIEFVGRPKKPNQTFSNFSSLSPYIDALQEELAAQHLRNLERLQALADLEASLTTDSSATDTTIPTSDGTN